MARTPVDDTPRTGGSARRGDVQPVTAASLPLRLLEVIRETYIGFRRDQGILLGAAITYYALFALGPILLLSVTLAGFVIGEQKAGGEVSKTLEDYFGAELAYLIDTAFSSATTSRYATTATIVGVGALLYAVIRLFVKLQMTFNVMWGVRLHKGVARRQLIRSRSLLALAVVVPGILLVASVILGSFVSWFTTPFGLSANLVTEVAERSVPSLITWVTFTALFAVLPDVRLSWRDVWRGALVTALAWTTGTTVLSAYFSWPGSTSFYGVAGGVLALLVWTHYMALIVVVGIRLTRVLYERAGNPIRPAPYAIRVHEVLVTGHDEPRPAANAP